MHSVFRLGLEILIFLRVSNHAGKLAIIQFNRVGTHKTPQQKPYRLRSFVFKPLSQVTYSLLVAAQAGIFILLARLPALAILSVFFVIFVIKPTIFSPISLILLCHCF